MKKILLTAAFCGLLLVIKSGAAKAQTTAQSNVAVSIATVTEITANNTNLASFNFTNGAELETGITQENAVVLAYKSNKVTKIQIKALGSGFFTGGVGTLPIGVIRYKKNGAGSFVALTTSSADLSASQAKGSSSFGVDYQIVPGLQNDPATDYSATIEYTITAQ